MIKNIQEFVRHRPGFFWFIVALLFLDRSTKYLAVTVLAGNPVSLFPGVRLQLLLNQGLALSLPIDGIWLAVSTAFAIFLVTVFFIHAVARRKYELARWLFLLLVGAASNIADRLFYGGVVDILEIGFFPVLNIADLMILSSLGAIAIRDFRRAS